MTFVRLLVVLLLTALPALAQADLSRKVDSETIDGINGVEGGAAIVSLPSARQPTRAAHRVIDKKFIFVMSALGATESIRFTSRKLVLYNEFAAGAPWVTHVPGNQNLVAKYGALYAAELLVAYEMKKPHSWLPGDRAFRKLWWAYPAAMATIHLKNGIGNIVREAPEAAPPYNAPCKRNSGLKAQKLSLWAKDSRVLSRKHSSDVHFPPLMRV